MLYKDICHLFIAGTAGETDDGISGYAAIITDHDGNMLHVQSGAFDDGPDSGTGGGSGARIRAFELGSIAARDLDLRKCMLHADADITADAMYSSLTGRAVRRDEDRDPDHFGTGVYTAFVRDTPPKPWWGAVSDRACRMAEDAARLLR